MEKLYVWLILAVAALCFFIFATAEKPNVLTKKSDFSFVETSIRLEKSLMTAGMSIFNRINHSENAVNVDIELRNTELFIFGNPEIGSQLMKCSQQMGLELPLKILVWEDKNEDVWLSYNNPKYFSSRYNLRECKSLLSGMQQGLKKITETVAATSK